MNFIFHNFWLKTLALFLAGMFWVWVIISSSTLRSFPVEGGIVPEVFNLPEGLTVSSELPEVNLMIDANQKSIENLKSENFSIFVDLKGRTVGTHEIKISATTDEKDVLIQDINPQMAEIILEQITEKLIPVRVKIEGNVSENFTTDDPILEFTEVYVRGGKKSVSSVSEALAIIKLNGEEDENILKTWELVPINANGEVVENVELENSSVAITIPLTQIAITKHLPSKVNIIGAEENENYQVSKITIDPLFVDVRGDAKVLEQIDSLQTQPINVEYLNGNTTKTVGWELPDGVELAKTSPAVAIVWLEIQEKEINLNPNEEENE